MAGLFDVLAVCGFALQLLLVWRCLVNGAARAYPFFFAYALYTAVRTPLVLYFYFWQPKIFPTVYWISRPVAEVLWFCVAWEVFRQAFPRRSALHHVAGTFLWWVLAGLALWFYNRELPGKLVIPDVLRTLGLTVAVMLIGTLALARYYGLPLGQT